MGKLTNSQELSNYKASARIVSGEATETHLEKGPQGAARAELQLWAMWHQALQESHWQVFIYLFVPIQFMCQGIANPTGTS